MTVAALLLGAGCEAAKAEMITSEFVALYQKGSAADKQLYEKLASSTENGMQWFSTMSNVTLYCHPPKMALTGNQLLDIMRRQSASNEMVAGAPWGLGMLYALKNTFPCPEKKP